MTLEEAQQRYPPMWVIYDHPSDFPDKFVVRCCYGLIKHPIGWLYDTLEEARDAAERFGGSARIPRSPDDDPVIVETWI